MERFLSFSIRKQLLLIVLIASLPAAGILLYSSLMQREEAIKAAHHETQKLAAIIAAEQGYRVAAAEQILKVIAKLPEVKRRNAERVAPLLGELLDLHTQYSNIFITDMAGTVWASALPSKGTVNVADRRYFKGAVSTGRLSSGEYLVSRFTNKLVLTLAYPYRNEKGALAGVIVLGFDLAYYKHLLSDAELASGKGYLLLDHKGTILARPLNPESYVGKPFVPELFLQMVNGPDEGMLEEMGMDGQRRYISYSKQWLEGEQTPYLYIRAAIPVNTVLSRLNLGLLKNLALFSLFLASALVLAWLIGKRSIVDRVALLETASHQLAEGNLQVKVADVVKGGELGSLGMTFDSMAEQLKARDAEKNTLIKDLQTALADVKTLRGLLPVCSSCKKIRNDEGSWMQMEVYISQHSDAEFTHGLCSDCAGTLYPKYYKKDQDAPKG